MTGMTHRFLWMSVTVMLLTFIVSCGRFEYGYDENNPGATMPNESMLNFSVSWAKSGLSSSQIPAEVTVLMSRKVNSVHYVWNVDGTGKVLLPDEDVTPSIPTILNGDYYTVAYSDGAGFYQFSSYDEFVNDPAQSMAGLYAMLPALTDEEVSHDKDLCDFNPYAGFISSAEYPLYLAIVKDVLFPNYGAAVVLQPENLVRRLTFRIKVTSEKGVQINGISTVLSGVATGVQLMSGLVLKSSTAKVAFDMNRIGKDGVYDIYEGTVSLLGLFAPEDRAYVTGPGILQVSVSASVSENGKENQRVFHAGMNMKRILETADVMVESDDRTGYKMKPQSSLRTIEIGTALKVLKNQILSSDTEGLYEWFENDVEIMPEV